MKSSTKNELKGKTHGVTGAVKETAGQIINNPDLEAEAGQSNREAEVQSGDTQGLSKVEQANSESVEELAADGQAFEAEAVSGVEDAADPDVHEVKTREVPEDDVPREYDEQ